MARKYKTKQLISGARGTLVVTCRITDYKGFTSVQDGITTENDLRENFDLAVHSAQLNAVYKHMRANNLYIRKSEDVDGASVDTYVKELDMLDWYIIYYQTETYAYKRSYDKKEGKYYTLTFRKGKLENKEQYKKGDKDTLTDITRSYVVSSQKTQTNLKGKKRAKQNKT